MAYTNQAGVPGLKAIAFDAYGTLFDVFSVTSLCERLAPGHGAALAQLWRAKQLQYTLLRSMMQRHEDFWRITRDSLVHASRILTLSLSDQAIDRLMGAYLTLTAFPDAEPGLRALKRRGLRLAIVSNGAPTMLERAVAHAGLADVLDAIISIEDVAVFKPAPQVYALAASRLGLRDAEVGFVSSNNWDIQGAGSAGLHTFWIQRNQSEPEERLGYPANHIVRSLEDLPPLVAPVA